MVTERLVQDAPLDVLLKQVLDDIPFAARREHCHERRVADVQLRGARSVLAPI